VTVNIDNGFGAASAAVKILNAGRAGTGQPALHRRPMNR
jgi:hypothetical protein